MLERCRELLGADPLLLAPPAESRAEALCRIFDFEPELCPSCKLGRLIVRAEWRACRSPLDAILATLAPRAPVNPALDIASFIVRRVPAQIGPDVSFA